ncbi:MAG TPA: hypothetical protein VFM37_14355 [Pseudonocardiaceae bacterium]|nr:hypothetical protein [Pseudonocardiaceae bacterium]
MPSAFRLRISRPTSTSAPPGPHRGHRPRLLLVLDNAGSTEQVRPLLPGTPSCLVLVTSRDSLGGLVALHGARWIELDLPPEADAVELLARLVGDRVAAELAADGSDDRAAALTGLLDQYRLPRRGAARRRPPERRCRQSRGGVGHRGRDR